MTTCGFDSLPNQVTTRHTIHGLSFNVLVMGSTGIGKTTLINSLFDFDYGDPIDNEPKTNEVYLRVKEFRPQNKTIDMKLTIMETKGFDNQLDKSESYRPIIDYIDSKYEEYLKHELTVQETRYNDIADGRVHCCIYMISPVGSGLSANDLVALKNLHQRVCLIPVIARADILTKQERYALAETVRQQLNQEGISIYPQANGPQLPFAIAASNEVVTEKSKRLRVRAYPWGRFDIETHSEFPKLRELVLKSDMLSLVEHTNKVHYEKYRMEATSCDKVAKNFDEFKSKYDREKATILKEIERLEGERTRSPYRRSSFLSTSVTS